MEKVSPNLLTLISSAVEEIRKTIQHAKLIGMSQSVFFRPLMLGAHHNHFKEGVRFEVVKRSPRKDVLAAGGQ
jgi:translation initiation factor 2-alpha kinase 4